MKVNQKKITKTIYFTDLKEDRFPEITNENYQVFDRKKIVPHKKGISKDVFNYFSNTNLEQEFISIVKNKKIVNIIYRLHYNNPDKILENIRDNILGKIKNIKNFDIKFKFVVLEENHTAHGMKTNQYDEIIILR